MPVTLGFGIYATISSDTVAASGSLLLLRTEGGAASDDLSTITGGSEGTVIVLRVADPGYTITVNDTVGNICLNGNFVMDSHLDSLALYCSGQSWIEISRSNNEWPAIVAMAAVLSTKSGSISVDARVNYKGTFTANSFVALRARAAIKKKLQSSIYANSVSKRKVYGYIVSGAAIKLVRSGTITVDSFVDDGTPPWVLVYSISAGATIDNPVYKSGSVVSYSVVMNSRYASIGLDGALLASVTGSSVTLDAKIGTVT